MYNLFIYNNDCFPMYMLNREESPKRVLVLIDSYYRIGLEYIMFVFSDFEFIYLYLMFIVLNK